MHPTLISVRTMDGIEFLSSDETGEIVTLSTIADAWVNEGVDLMEVLFDDIAFELLMDDLAPYRSAA